MGFGPRPLRRAIWRLTVQALLRGLPVCRSADLSMQMQGDWLVNGNVPVVVACLWLLCSDCWPSSTLAMLTLSPVERSFGPDTERELEWLLLDVLQP